MNVIHLRKRNLDTDTQKENDEAREGCAASTSQGMSENQQKVGESSIHTFLYYLKFQYECSLVII